MRHTLHCRTAVYVELNAVLNLLDEKGMGTQRAQERIAAWKLLQYDAMLIATLGVGCLLGGGRPPARLLLRGLRQCMLLMTGVYLLSPLLQACQTPRPSASFQEGLDLAPLTDLCSAHQRSVQRAHSWHERGNPSCAASIGAAAVLVLMLRHASCCSCRR